MLLAAVCNYIGKQMNMGFLRRTIDKVLAQSQLNYIRYFNAEDSIYSQRKSISYLNYYFAIGRFVGEDVQRQYTRRVRLFIGMNTLLSAGGLTGFFLIVLAIVIKSEDWPSWDVTWAFYLGAVSLAAITLYKLCLEPWLRNRLKQTFEREMDSELAKLMTSKPKPYINWPTLVLLALVILIGFVKTWELAGIILLVATLSIPFTLAEGFIILLLIDLKHRLFPAKRDTEIDTEQSYIAPPEFFVVEEQAKKRLFAVYQAVIKGEFERAFQVFDEAEISLDEFTSGLQEFLAENQLSQFSNHPLTDGLKESITYVESIAELSFEISLTFYEEEAESAPELYLVCRADYKGEQLTRLVLKEIDF